MQSIEKLRLAIITEDDGIWALSLWERTIAKLQGEGVEVVGLWLSPAVLTRYRGRQIRRWYLRTFGIRDFAQLYAFALTAKVLRRYRAARGRAASSFEGLSRESGVPLMHCKGPNDTTFIEWVRENEIDLLVTLVCNILRDNIIAAPRIAVLNKHGSMLPTNKGLFPFIWAVINATAQGVSIHKIVRGIDEGEVVAQESVPEGPNTASMVAFNLHMFRIVPTMLMAAIRNVLENRTVPFAAVEPSYFGLPDKDVVRRFRRQGGKIVRLSDIGRAQEL